MCFVGFVFIYIGNLADCSDGTKLWLCNGEPFQRIIDGSLRPRELRELTEITSSPQALKRKEAFLADHMTYHMLVTQSRRALGSKTSQLALGNEVAHTLSHTHTSNDSERKAQQRIDRPSIPAMILIHTRMPCTCTCTCVICVCRFLPLSFSPSLLPLSFVCRASNNKENRCHQDLQVRKHKQPWDMT